MARIDVDREEWPLVIYTFDGQATEEMVQGYVEAIRENISRAERTGEKYVSIVVSDNMRTTAAHRKKIATSIEGFNERIAGACLGNALVTSSPLMRGLLTSLKWVIEMPVPVQTCSTLEEAKAWAREQLSRAGAPLPSAG